MARVSIFCHQMSSVSALFPTGPRTAEHWEAPQNLSDAAAISTKHSTNRHLPSAVPWMQIEGPRDTSGLGYCFTPVTWPPAHGAADGAYHILPTVEHAARIYVNGKRSSAIDLAAPRVDLET